MELAVKAIIGAGVVVLIQLLARSRNFYIAGLVPLFPTFALIAHYAVGTERTTGELKTTILFGMFAAIPYFAYMVALYFLVDRCKLPAALAAATLLWLVCAAVLVVVWNRV